MKETLLVNQYSKADNLLPKLVLFLIVLLSCCFLFTSKTEASITNTFPLPINADKGQVGSPSVMAASSKSGRLDEGGQNGLDSVDISFKVFKPVSAGNGPSTIKLLDACINPWGHTSGGDKGNRRIVVSAWRTNERGSGYETNRANETYNFPSTSYGCTDSDNNPSNGNDRKGPLEITIPAEHFTFNQSQRYGYEFKTALIVVQKMNQEEAGIKHFRVQAPTTHLVTFDDVSPADFSDIRYRTYNYHYPGLSAFALHEADGGAGESRYRLNFAVDCTYQTSRSVWLKWSDADNLPGQKNYDDDIRWRFNGGGKDEKRGRDGIWPGESTAGLGGQGYTYSPPGTDPRPKTYHDVGTLRPDSRYTWTWENVNANNGLQLWMPFSEASAFITTCPPPPCPPGTPGCPGTPGGTGRRAACSVTGNQVPGLPANSGNTVNVVAGKTFNLNGNFRNTGGVALYAGPTQKAPEFEWDEDRPSDYGATKRHNYGLRFHNNGPWQWGKPEWALFAANPNGMVEAGDSRPIPINDLMAPSAPGTYTINVEPDHFGWGPAGRPDGGNPFYITACPVTINVYEEYVFDTSASRNNPDVENPAQINYSGGVNQVAPNPTKSITATVRYGLTLEGVGQVDGATDGPKGFQGEPPPYSRTYNVPSPQLGQKYCSTLRMSIGAGSANTGSQAKAYVGPNGVVYPVQDGVADDCYRIENRPYVRAYGGDVAAGGGFENIVGDSCGSTDSGILAFLRPLAEQEPRNTSGSGGQLAAMALGDISGFTSASTRRTPPQLPRGLTFGHDKGTITGYADSLNPLLGGNMTGNGWCVPDFFKTTQFPESDTDKRDASESTGAITVTSSVLKKNAQTVRDIGGSKLTLNGSKTVSYNNRHTIYVDGDVFINDDIRYKTDYGTGTDAIPSFTLVVRGNIYIENDVTRLDGLYIAQPAVEIDSSTGQQVTKPNTGRIYTCANAAGNAVLSGGELFSSCGAQNPTQLTVNGAFIAQRVVLNRSGLTLRDSTFREEPGTSKAAEIFSFNPEIYLSPPVFRPNSTPTSGDYDYISILAPTL